MARVAKHREPAIIFKHPVQIEVRRPKFEAFASLRQLDLDKLERADLAKVELGYVNTECCQSLVKATIRKGMVTEVRVESCKTDDRSKLSPDMKKLVDA